MEQMLSSGALPPGMTHERFSTGIEDVVILPLVAVALVVKKALRATLTLLIHILDFAFPILLQVMRFPLFTLRILGDGIVALLKGVVRFLPVGGTRRAAWRDLVSRHWAWLRGKISYKAFEEAVHHAFENGMAWVFRKCRTLTPRAALLVLSGAILWLPISFGAATLLHAVLIAKATSLPAWMQLLHPVATIIAKSKLLVLPVYPASWPQAKRHPLVQAMMRFWTWVTTLYLVRKTGYRYVQIEYVGGEAAEALRRTAAYVGLSQLWSLLLSGINETAVVLWWVVHLTLLGLVRLLAAVPLFGGVVQRYADHYDEAGRQPAEPLSEKVSDFYARWSVKFTAEYYEAKEREQTVKGHAGV